jgi:23S rRNA U2552 (ribose-2'-O)-methylase RlmE/FtsJ
MYSVTLPKTSFTRELHSSINLTVSCNNNANDISYIGYSTKKYLNDTKGKIEENLKQWEYFKRYTNSYEYIHTPVLGTKHSISNLKPISRAFFKLIEIFNLIELSFEQNIKTFHLAEGPGGFIEATSHYRNNKNDIYYAMTLISTDHNIPGWSKGRKFITDNPNVSILPGKDRTGNLYSVENYKDCVETFKNSIDLITADGGFDFSIDFTKQETVATRLILTEIIYAITMQKKGGVFILKIFDVFNKTTLDIIYILSILYEMVTINKPNTSRPANSEKYIICQGFLLEDSDKYISKFIDILECLNSNDNYIITSLLDIDISCRFKTFIEEMNIIMAYNQIDNILTTLKLMENKDRRCDKNLINIKNNSIKCCIEWCMENNIPYNNVSFFNENKTNIFKRVERNNDLI